MKNYLLIITILSLMTLQNYNNANTLNLPDKESISIRKGINLLYNTKYDKALQIFTSLKSKFINHPAPWFFTAMVYWLQNEYMVEMDKTGYYFIKNINIAMKKAQKLLIKNPKNAQLYFYLAGGMGFLGRYHMNNKNWYSAFTSGWKAYKILKKIKKQKIFSNDIYMGLGFFNFFADKIPKSLKKIALLLGIKGDYKLGLKQLHIAAKHGLFAKIEANIILGNIYTYNHKIHHKAKNILSKLIDDFPLNPGLRIALTDALINSRNSDTALKHAFKCLTQVKQGINSKKWLFRIYSRIGKVYMQTHKYKKAMKYLNMSLKQKYKNPESYIPWVYLRRGKIFSIYGFDKLALNDFNMVIKLEPMSTVAKYAKSYINNLFKKAK